MTRARPTEKHEKTLARAKLCRHWQRTRTQAQVARTKAADRMVMIIRGVPADWAVPIGEALLAAEVDVKHPGNHARDQNTPHWRLDVVGFLLRLFAMAIYEAQERLCGGLDSKSLNTRRRW